MGMGTGSSLLLYTTTHVIVLHVESLLNAQIPGHGKKEQRKYFLL